MKKIKLEDIQIKSFVISLTGTMSNTVKGGHESYNGMCLTQTGCLQHKTYQLICDNLPD